MLKDSQHIKIKWGTKNKKWYTEKDYHFTNYGDELLVRAEDLMKTSNAKVILICDICGTEEFLTTFYNYSKAKSKEYHCESCVKTRNSITVDCYSCGQQFISTKTAQNKSKSGYLFCSNKCVGAYNAIYKKTSIEKTCVICNEKYEVKPSIAKNSVTCSTQCQAKWQSTYLIGKNANNFKGGNRIKTCEHCNEEYECNSPYQVNHRRFCSVICKENHWIENTLTSSQFIQNRYEGNLTYRTSIQFSKKETKPERMVREWLEQNNEYFKQEQGFFRKYFADFYFPAERAVIEVMGDYWHGNPLKYGEGKMPLSEQQVKQIEKDKTKKLDFEKHNFIYVELWENDIYEDVNKVMNEAMLKIYPRNDYTPNIQTVFRSEDEDIV